MSTTPVTVSVSPLSSILDILSVALNALAVIPALGGSPAIAGAFVQIIQSAMNAYHAQTGQPIDLSKIPLETPVA